MSIDRFAYDNRIVRNFAFATILWGVVGMLLGLIIAFQLPFPVLNVHETLSFGRLRPLHTNAAIFAFVGNAIFMGVYYSLQRLCKARMFSDILSEFHFWSWQAIILAAAITLPLGFSTGKEYAELEWPIDIAIAVSWVVFGFNMIATIIKRRERHMYVAIWFYLATFIAVAVLHIFNSLALPLSFLKSYPIYAGVQDALIQWWYGHNAVAFFLTTPYLGLMYYFLPKAANRPVYSYKLSIIHFWSLIFIYIWAGPHHLIYSAVPSWAQTLGIVFSIMLIAPSWGGMLNGLLTLRGAWDRVRNQPELKFMVVAVTCYGMVTLEGPLMSIKSINYATHFTDWVIGHVHNGTLGWNGFMTFGILYWIIPKIYRTELFSKKLANIHFWIGTVGIVIYVLSMYFSSITQFLMWQKITPDGTLEYSNFMQTVLQILPMYHLRALGGLIYFTGVLLMVYNLAMTVRWGNLEADEPAEGPSQLHPEKSRIFSHDWLTGQVALFLILTLLGLLVGSLVENVPVILSQITTPTQALVKPYTPLELQGRDIYVSEGCNTCHSQMIRPFVEETLRYATHKGNWQKMNSEMGDYVYDHPFLWGSKRTGPDLLRIGGKYPDSWHYNHMLDPRSTSADSIMPPYAHLLKVAVDLSKLGAKLQLMQTLGVPYTNQEIFDAKKAYRQQAEVITDGLKAIGIEDPQLTWDKEIIAVIAYLQGLGQRISVPEKTPVE